MTSISVPLLRSMSNLYVESVPQLTTLAFPQLTTSTNGFALYNLNLLNSVSLPLLKSMADLSTGNLPQLETLALPELTGSSSGLRVENLSKLSSLTLPLLAAVNNFDVSGNPLLTSLALPALTAVTSRLSINSNALLATLTLPLLTRVEYVEVNGNPELTALALPALTTSTEGFTINGNSLLATLDLPVFTAANNFQVSYNVKIVECPVLRLAITIATGSVDVYGNDTTIACVPTDFCRRLTMTGFSDSIYHCVRQQTFTTANTTCSGLSMAGTGGLLWLTSDADWAPLQSLSGRFGQGWLGLTDTAVENTWVSTNSSVMYTPTTRTDFWAGGEPNDSGNEDCAMVYNDGRANDGQCGSQQRFYCRVP